MRLLRWLRPKLICPPILSYERPKRAFRRPQLAFCSFQRPSPSYPLPQATIQMANPSFVATPYTLFGLYAGVTVTHAIINTVGVDGGPAATARA